MSADFVSFWQHLPQKIDPVILRAGPVELRWYGLMYLVIFAIVYVLVRRRLRDESGRYPFSNELFTDYLPWAAIGVLAGGRLGYVFFYDPSYYLADPVRVISPFSPGGKFTGISGMSFHGGLLGIIAATAIFSRKNRVSFWKWTDLLAPAVPLGYFFGRIGNFLNGELYGRATVVPWGMFFPRDPSGQLRHPSQLYEAFLEGLVLFAVLWGLRKRPLPPGALACLYLVGYGVFRFAVEFWREPDPQLGLLLGPLTMGQLFSAAMAAAGLFVLFLRTRHAKTSS